jgi:integrase/recombinase XerD
VEDADPLFDERKALIDFVLNLLPNQKVFPVHRSTFWRKIQRYAKAAGIPKHKAHPHALKHSIAMQTIGTAGIENVRTYLGHKSMGSTGEYLKVQDAEASAAIQNARNR